MKTFCALAFDLNYSGSTLISSTGLPGGLIAYPATTPTRVGYVFSGWYKNTACTDPWNFGTDTVSGDLTLYAGWVQGTAPGNLSVAYVMASDVINGSTVIMFDSYPGTGNSFVYKVSSTPVSGLFTDTTVTDGVAFDNGSTAVAVILGQYVTIYEINSENKVVNYGCLQIDASEIKPGVNAADMNFDISGTTATVTGYTGNGGDVVIPGTISYGGVTYTVTAIADDPSEDSEGTFGSGNTTITSVTIPDSVTTIGGYAFYGCTALTSAILGNGVTSIGGSAFQDCASLKTLTLGSSVTNIGDWAFRNCSGLTTVTIPDSVTSIGVNAFRNCTGLTSVTVGSGVTSLKNYAFGDCSKLTAAYFKGDKPFNFVTNAFNSAASQFVLYYPISKSASWSTFTTYTKSAYCLLTLDPNYSGGTPTSGLVKVDENNHIAAPADLTRDDYTFGGWYTEAACQNAFNFAGTTVTGDLMLFAKWNAYGTYYVTTDSGISGGSVAASPSTGTAGTVITVTVTPDTSKQFVAGSLKYTTNGGNTYTAITATAGVYSFTLPAANVVVIAQFETAIGDVNGDGSINILDVVQAVDFALGKTTPTTEQFNAVDFNKDGSINILDVVQIVNKALGK